MARRLPFSTVSLVFGILSVPLAFAGHLVSLALLLGLLAMLLGLLGLRIQASRPGRYAPAGEKRARWAWRLGLAGTLSGMIMWLLWAGGQLF